MKKRKKRKTGAAVPAEHCKAAINLFKNVSRQEVLFSSEILS